MKKFIRLGCFFRPHNAKTVMNRSNPHVVPKQSTTAPNHVDIEKHKKNLDKKFRSFKYVSHESQWVLAFFNSKPNDDNNALMFYNIWVFIIWYTHLVTQCPICERM